MRDIKFRAWSEKYRKMFRVDDLTEDFLSNHAYKISFMRESCNLMQYTGLHDKNGKEIYEGDIVKWDKPIAIEITQVLWDSELPRFVFADRENERFMDYCGSDLIEVIGNIYENPDLIPHSP